MGSKNGFNTLLNSALENSDSDPASDNLATPVPPTPSSRHRVLTRSLANFRRTNANKCDRSDCTTELIKSTFPQYSAVGITEPANGQPVGGEEMGQQMTPQVNCAARCNAFLDWYKDAVVDFRNSKLVLIMQFLISHIPISALIMGCLFSKKCPLPTSLPDVLLYTGVVGMVFVGLWIVLSCREYAGLPCSKYQRWCLGILFGLLLSGVIVEMVLLSRLPSSDSCSDTFYYCLVYREVGTVAALVVALLVYLPRERPMY